MRGEVQAKFKKVRYGSDTLLRMMFDKEREKETKKEKDREEPS